MISTGIEIARRRINSHIDSKSSALRQVNIKLHGHPETAYQEFFAHDSITAFLEEQGFKVKRHAYGLETSFEAEIGSGGRLIVYCAEDDALPNIGHACGHNLIATSSIGAFLGAATALRESGFAGRIRLLGTPAEEGGGGKVKLIDAGAFKDDVAAAIMVHPASQQQISSDERFSGCAGIRSNASYKLRIEYKGKPAHAAGDPWNGINALDAAVAAYNNVALLRQQIQDYERVHGVIEVGGTVPNVITEYTRMNWYVRCPTTERGVKLLDRVKACFEAAAITTGCTLTYNYAPTYLNLLENLSLCQVYVDDMAVLGEEIMLRQDKAISGSTDMGNVSHIVPSFHGTFVIKAPRDIGPHHPDFAASAGTDEAHEAAIKCAKGMAMIGFRVLTDDALATAVRNEFENIE